MNTKINNAPLPLLIFIGLLVSLSLAALATWHEMADRRSSLDRKVSEKSDELIVQMAERIFLYQYGLRGLKSFVLNEELNRELTRQAFDNYSSTRDMATEFPGARGFGFIRRVGVAEEPQFIQKVKSDNYPDFAVRQLQPHSNERYIIEFVSPLEANRAAMGLDIASEQHRRSAAQRAITMGEVQLTAPITLVQATGNPLQSFLILMPVYRAWQTPTEASERWAKAIGWTYAPLLMKEILDSLKVDDTYFHLRLTDITDPANSETFYELNGAQPFTSAQVRTKLVYGRTWQLELEGTPLLASSLNALSIKMFFLNVFFGALVSCGLLIALISYWQTRAKLFRQASSLASFVEASSDAIIGADLNGIILSWNKGAETIFGFSAEETEGLKSLNEIMPLGFEVEGLQMLHNAREGRREAGLVTHRLRKNGCIFDALINMEPILDEGKEVVGLSVTIKDISALKEAEEKLQLLNENLEQEVAWRTEELSRSLRENQAILKVIEGQYLFSITDPHGEIIVVNENFCRASGYSQQELLGENHRIMNSHYHPREFWSQMWNAIYKGDSWRAEVCNLTRDGDNRWFDTVITPILDEEGKPERIIAVRSDVTERKRVDLELRAAQDQFNVAAEVAKLGVWTWDVQTNALSWNEHMFAIYEQPLELKTSGLHYIHWRDRLHPEDLEPVEHLLQQALAGSADFDMVFRIVLPSKKIRYIKAGSQVERDRFDKVVRVTGINIDITDQYQLEQELRRAKNLADDASASKSQFLANMSHEIRTPMNGVLGMLALVQRTQLTAQQSDYVKKANSAAKSLLGILNDILDFSKIAAGKMTLDPIEFNVEEMLSELGHILAGNLNGKAVEILLDRDLNLPETLVGDRLRLLQVLINLSGNALKFTEEGNVIVRLALLEKDEKNVRLRIEVKDTGIGMTEEQQSNLFESFTQAEASTTRRYGGTGLGLSICKRLLELMGSELQLKSKLNAGSVFYFDLTLGYINHISAGTPDAHKDVMQHKVLVADDSMLMADMLCEGLSEKGWRVVKVNSALSALKAIESAAAVDDPFDVVLMDWNMPGMNGFEASQKIRASKALSTLPQIIMITAHEKSLFSQVEHTGESPFDELLVKPVTIMQVDKALLTCLHGNAEPVQVEPPAEAMIKPLAGIRLLIVEDNELNRQIAYELLTQAGAEVDMAVCGVDGVAQAANSSACYDLVLMDIQMPDIDGFEATRRIRAQEKTAYLPIIAMTANASDSDRQACLDAGMSEHAAKPLDITKLVPLIRRHTNRDENTDAAPVLLPLGEEECKDDITATENNSLTEPVSAILNRFGGNRDLATRMRDRFGHEVNGLVVELDAAIQDKNLAELISVCHSLKGVAATLGAVRLATAASTLESVGRQGLWPSAESIVELHELIETSVIALEQLRFGNEAAEPKVVLDPGKLKSRLDEIRLFLQDDNMNAMPLAETLMSNYDSIHEVKMFYEQVESLNFSEALHILPRVEEVLLNGKN